MAVPTLDELHDYLTSVVDGKSHNGQHVVFDWEYLCTAAFRHFKSTSPAIDRRMEELVTDGRLVGVSISHNGYVTLDHAEFKHSLFVLYFTYANTGRGYGGSYGYITHKRPQNHLNPWANGRRQLYTTKAWLDAMTTAFLEAKKRHHEAQQKKQDEEESRTKDALDALAPDAHRLLERLGKAIPGIERRVLVRSVANGERFCLTLDMYSAEDIASFLDILRRGLPDVPRETKEDT